MDLVPRLHHIWRCLLTEQPVINLTDLNAVNGVKLDNFQAQISHAGDVNGDQIEDIILGNNGCNPPYYGCVYIVFGGSWLTEQASIDVLSLNQTRAIRFDGAHEYDNVGTSVSGIGDVNNDGFDDVAVGASAGPNSPLLFTYSEAHGSLSKAL